MTTRRELLIAWGAGVLGVPLAGFAQQQRPKAARIGFLEADSASSSKTGREALVAGLRELGLVEGKNVFIEYRWADGKYERLAGLAAELVQMKVDVIVAAATPSAQAARQATNTIPVVMLRAGDPVGTGLVASLARPGGNITGLSSVNADVSSKYLELLRAAVPRLARVAVLVNPGNAVNANALKRVQAAAQASGVKVLPLQASTESQIEAAFAAVKQERAEALVVLTDPFLRSQGRQIAELAMQQRLPTMFPIRDPVELGGLMSYGQNIADQYYRAATYVDKILKGAKPGDLPVEQPTKFDHVINLKTAKALGITIPPDLLVRADKVIE